MDNRIIYISLVAIIPTLLLCGYIYLQDRVEKEPAPLLFVLFFSGAIGFIPAYYLMSGASTLLDHLFASQMEYSIVEGITKFSGVGMKYIHYSLYSFVCIALIGELIKWLCLILITRENKNFNCLFDGIIYSVFVSLGYGVVEGIRYALVDGWDSFLFRLISLAPGYFLYGVVMGIFYTIWFVRKKAANYETQLLKEGEITEKLIKNPWKWLVASLVIPVLLRGIAEFVNLCDYDWLTNIYYVLILLLHIICFLLTGWFSANDEKMHEVVEKQLEEEHGVDIECDEVDYEQR